MSPCRRESMAKEMDMSQSDRPGRRRAAALLAVAIIGLSAAPVRAADDDDTNNNDYAEKVGNVVGGGVQSVEKFIGLGKPPAPPPSAPSSASRTTRHGPLQACA